MQLNRPNKLSRIERFAKSFPSLRAAPGVSPWEPLKLDDWVATRKPSHGEIVTAKFVLAVWNPHEEWKSGRFDFMEAMSVWDLAHREVILAWAADPWWA